MPQSSAGGATASLSLPLDVSTPLGGASLGSWGMGTKGEERTTVSRGFPCAKLTPVFVLQRGRGHQGSPGAIKQCGAGAGRGGTGRGRACRARQGRMEAVEGGAGRDWAEHAAGRAEVGWAEFGWQGAYGGRSGVGWREHGSASLGLADPTHIASIQPNQAGSWSHDLGTARGLYCMPAHYPAARSVDS